MAKLWGDCITTGSLLLTLCLALCDVPGPAPFPLPAHLPFSSPACLKLTVIAHPPWQGREEGHCHLSILISTSGDLQPPWSWWEPRMARGNRVPVSEVSHSRGWWKGKGVPAHLLSPFIALSQRERAASRWNQIDLGVEMWRATDRECRITLFTVTFLQKCPKGYFLGLRITDDSNGLNSSPWNCEDQVCLESFA